MLAGLRGRGYTYPEAPLDGVHALPKQVHAQLLKAGARDGGVEVGSLEQGVDFDAGLGGAGQGSLGPLTGRQKTAHSPRVVADVLLVLPLELLHR
jgi:hypothetical protein